MATSAEGTDSSPDDLRVLGHAPRSLFDALRPSRVALAAERVPGPGGMAVAALQQEAVSGGGNDRPADVVVVGGRRFGPLPDGWTIVEDAPRALGVAYGMAAVRRRRLTGTWTWCVVPADALADGRAMEVVVLLGAAPHIGVVPVVVGGPVQGAWAAALLRACGVPVRVADDADPWSVLSALDHTCRAADRAVTAIVATAGEG